MRPLPRTSCSLLCGRSVGGDSDSFYEASAAPLVRRPPLALGEARACFRASSQVPAASTLSFGKVSGALLCSPSPVGCRSRRPAHSVKLLGQPSHSRSFLKAPLSPSRSDFCRAFAWRGFCRLQETSAFEGSPASASFAGAPPAAEEGRLCPTPSGKPTASVECEVRLRPRGARAALLLAAQRGGLSEGPVANSLELRCDRVSTHSCEERSSALLSPETACV